MWRIIELVAIAAIVLISITEFFLPLILNKPLFGSFRKKKNDSASIEEKISNAKQKIDDVKKVQNEVNSNFKSAEQLKKEADDLLNNTNN